MDRSVVNNGFKIELTLAAITVKNVEDDSSVTFTAAEAERVKNILSSAASVGYMAKNLPYVQSTPFRVIFHDESKFFLTKRGQEAGEGLSFRPNKIDRLVQAVNVALGMYKDNQIHRSGATPELTRSSFTVKDPPIVEG